MIPIIAALAIGAIAGAVIVSFWDEIKQALKSAITKVKEHLRKLSHAAIVGFTTYLKTRNIISAVTSAFKFYSKDKAGQYHETTVTKQISESELPEAIRRKVDQNRGQEVDISKELELELS